MQTHVYCNVHTDTWSCTRIKLNATLWSATSVLMLLTELQEGHLVCKKAWCSRCKSLSWRLFL